MKTTDHGRLNLHESAAMHPSDLRLAGEGDARVDVPHRVQLPDVPHPAWESRPAHAMISAREPSPWRVSSTMLDEVERLMQDCAGAGPALDPASRHHAQSKGKRWRAALTLAVAEQLEINRSSALCVSAAIELLHNASLVHDDLVDRDRSRRGQATVWREFGDATALNLGDLYIVGAFEALAKLSLEPNAAHVLSLFTRSLRRVINGHAQEMQQVRDTGTSLDAYAAMAKAKSGVLLSLPVLAPLTLSGAPDQLRQAAQAVMENIGLAYQMQDDLFDILGCKSGREPGGDLREGRMTLPAILFLSRATGAEQAAFAHFFGESIQGEFPATAEKATYWMQRFRQPDVLGACQAELQRVHQCIAGQLRLLPDPLRTLLEQSRNQLLPRGFLEELLPVTPLVPVTVHDNLDARDKTK